MVAGRLKQERRISTGSDSQVAVLKREPGVDEAVIEISGDVSRSVRGAFDLFRRERGEGEVLKSLRQRVENNIYMLQNRV